MNFEQNFDQPLDPNSPEYQSINEVFQIEPTEPEKLGKTKQEKPITLKEMATTEATAKEGITLKAPTEFTGRAAQVTQEVKQNTEEAKQVYDLSVKGGTDYLTTIINKVRDEAKDNPNITDNITNFYLEQKALNAQSKLKERADKSFDFLSHISDINTNDNTRDAWINSQYSGAFYSKSKDVVEEYNKSTLKDTLTPREFAGLRSLSYGKKDDFQDFTSKLQDPSVAQSEKDLIKAKIDKIGSNIDVHAGSGMIVSGDKEGIDLFNKGKDGFNNADKTMQQIEYDNPWSIQSFKDITTRAIQRGLITGEIADILTVTSDESGIPVERLAELNRLQQEAKVSKAYENFQKDISLENFSKNPLGIMLEVGLESLVALYRHGASRMAAGAAEGAIAGSVIPVIGTISGASTGFLAGTGMTSLNLEYSGKILEVLSDNGVDITNAKSLKEGFSNQELMSKAKRQGFEKGVPVAIFDMISAGIAGRYVTKTAEQIMTSQAPNIGKKILQGGKELLAQVGAGMAGEGIGQLVVSGKITDPNAIIMEGLGEVFGSAGEIVTGGAFKIAQRDGLISTKTLVSILAKDGKQFAFDNIDAHVGANVLSQEQADKFKQQLDMAETMTALLPKNMSVDAKASVIDLIGQRNRIISDAETLDDVFKKKASEKAKALDTQILDIFTKDEEKQKTYSDLIDRRREQYDAFQQTNKDNPDFTFTETFDEFNKRIDGNKNYLSELYDRAIPYAPKGLTEKEGANKQSFIDYLTNKTPEYATQESGRTQQEISKQGGIGQYKGVEGQQAQATDETDISNRPVSGTQEVKFQAVAPTEVVWEKSEEGKGDQAISSRNPVVQQAAQELKSGKISNEEYRATVSENSPILPITKFFDPATDNEIQNAFKVATKKESDAEKINTPVQEGSKVALRLDIPSYKANNTWVVSIHDGSTKNGNVLSYQNVARIKNVSFGVEPKAGLAIATGVPKTTIGRMFGEWQNIEGATSEERGANAKAIVTDIANNPDWVQVGMNPFRHSYFYDRSAQIGRPVTAAEEVVQVGGLVYAKNPEYGNWTDESYKVKEFLDSKGVPVQFQTQNKASEGQTETITAEMNKIGGAAIEFSADDNLLASGKADTKTFVNREGIVQEPKIVSISDFNGLPMMVTISDELTTGSIINPITGNKIDNLKGGLGFNYSQDNTNYAWAYTDEKTSNDTFNAAVELYNANKELFDKAWADGTLPKNHIPVAIVKMGTDAINSNEAIFRVLLDNLNTLPEKNLIVAYKAYSEDVNSQIKRLEAKSKLSASERNSLNGYKNIRDKYLKENKTLLDVVKNISQLNINTRPLVTDRITSGEVGLLAGTNNLVANKPATKALMTGLTKEDIKKIHLGYIAEPLREASIKNIPQRHVIGFVGIDISAKGPIAINTHPNYPFALKGQGLGILENTAHLASVMPTVYGNIIKKINDSVAKGTEISTGQAVSRAMPSGLANAIFKNKTLSNLDNLSKLIGFLNLSFPNVTFFTDEQSFKDIMSSEGVRSYLKNGEVVYGLTTDGKIYLNPKIATSNTAIHEMGHIWVDFVENMNKDLFSQGISLVEGTKEFEDAKARLGDTIAARKEALAVLIGNKGETITDAALKSKFQEYLVAVWKYLQETFPNLRNLTPAQIQNLTMEQFVGGALKDILSGKPISEVKGEYVKEGMPAQKSSEIVPTGGVPSVPGETGVGKVGETGLPEKKVYSWEKGGEGKPQPGETMIQTSTGRYVAIETMKGQQMDREKKVSEIEKAKPSFFKSAYSWLKVALIDNQAAVLTSLANIGKQGQLVKAYLLTRNSASATASVLSDNAIKEVYGDISKKKMFDINGAKISEYQLLNQMIGYQRVISIQQQMNDVYKSMIQALIDGNMAQYNIDKQRLLDNNMIDKNGDYVGENLDVEFAMGQVTSTQAKALLYETREAIGEAAFDKLMNSSKKYSDFLNSMLKSRMEAGLISEESYKYMSKFFYAPTKYISEILTDPILSLTKTSTSFRNESILRVKNLAGGSEKLNMSDYEGLLKAVTYASEYSIAENRATTRFYNLVSGNPTKFAEAGIRIGTKLVPITEEIGNKPGQVEDAIDRNIRMIVEGKKSSALELPSGQKALPFKGMQKVGEMGIQLYQAPIDVITDSNGNKFKVVQEPINEKEDYIKTYFNGQRYDIIVPKWFAEQWYNKNTITHPYITSATSFLSKVTGANFLRVVATGINPVFGVAQLIPDTISAYAATLEERKLPLLVDYPIFFAKTLLAARDIKSNSKDFQEAMKYGATTNFYNGGMVSFEQGLLGKEDKSLEKIIESWNVPGLKQYIMGSKRITETTEQMSKVALYKSIRDSKLAQFAKDNGKEPNAQEIEDIRIEAGAMARATADFHRKGVLGGELNKIIPYLNAGFQVQKAVISSAKANPNKALYYAMEFAAYGTMLTLSALGMGDDDELKEKKRKAYLKLSDFDRDNRVILYYIESKDRFVSIKLPDFLVPMQSLQRRLTERIYLENKSLNNKDAWDIASNVADAIPLTQFANPEKMASRNPAYSFIAKLKYNKDPYRQEDVVPYEKATKDYLEGAEAGKRRAGKIYQAIGKGAISPLLPEGISPKRMEAAVGSIPFQSNPFSGAILMGLEWSASEKDLFDERYGKNTRDVIMKASGITDRYMKEGSKINQNIIDLPMEEVKGRGEFKNTIAEILIPKFDSAVVNLTRPEALKKVRAEFINNEYKKLTPEQKEIARGFIEGELTSIAKTKTKDEFILQIAKMAGSDAKIDGIVETISTIKVSQASKVQFIRDLVDAGLVSSPGTQKSMNVRGRRTLTTGEKNPYYEPQVGYIRDEILKYTNMPKKPQ